MVIGALLQFVNGEVEYWATGGQGYSRESSAAVIDYAPQPQQQPRYEPEAQYQEPQHSQQEDLSECPPLYVPQQFTANLDNALDIVHKCGVWEDFCRVTIDVKYNPSAPTAQMGCPPDAVHRGIKGTQCNMEIGTEFLGLPPEDLSFAILHEVYHGIRRYDGKPYTRTQEENDCNNWADKKLKAAGYSHNFRILPNGSVIRTTITVGFGGRKIIQEKVYKL